MARQAALIRIGTLRPQDVIPHILEWAEKDPTQQRENRRLHLERHEFLGHSVNLDSTRLHCFAAKGLACVRCGIVGQYFAVERFPTHESAHINLYAVDIVGDEILMTRDHVRPRSKGGPDRISNCQTMCSVCNLEKGSKLEGKQNGQENAQELVP